MKAADVLFVKSCGTRVRGGAFPVSLIDEEVNLRVRDSEALKEGKIDGHYDSPHGRT